MQGREPCPSHHGALSKSNDINASVDGRIGNLYQVDSSKEGEITHLKNGWEVKSAHLDAELDMGMKNHDGSRMTPSFCPGQFYRWKPSSLRQLHKMKKQTEGWRRR